MSVIRSAFMFRSSGHFQKSCFILQKFKTSTTSAHRFSTKTDLNNKFGWPQWEGVLRRFVPLGVCLIAVMQWRAYRRRHGDTLAKQWEINCYCFLPLRTVSRCWGYLADRKIPEPMRPYIYNTYAKTFGVDISEALNPDLKSYTSLCEFFVRALKDGVRPIDSTTSLVSPCDGTVLSVGTVHNGQVEQVKGVTYYVQDFLGEKMDNPKDVHKTILHQPENGNTLYQCVIYLAPGDYHRFHSPTDWQPTHRRHFSGDLLSVNPRIAKWLPGLFVLNERAVYLGKWKHGFFSYTAVGATNVGSIRVYFDKSLHTNFRKKTYKFDERCLGSKVNLTKGELVGEFRMGSTIVVIFEAPTDFNFNVSPGQKVKLGESLGNFEKQKYVDRIDKKFNVRHGR